MKIEVLHSQWGADDQVFPGGVTEIDKPSKQLLKHAAAAEAAGAIKVTASKEERAKMGDHVEPDSVSLKVQEKAQDTGAWQIGNLMQHELDVELGNPTGAV